MEDLEEQNQKKKTLNSVEKKIVLGSMKKYGSVDEKFATNLVQSKRALLRCKPLEKARRVVPIENRCVKRRGGRAFAARPFLVRWRQLTLTTRVPPGAHKCPLWVPGASGRAVLAALVTTDTYLRSWPLLEPSQQLVKLARVKIHLGEIGFRIPCVLFRVETIIDQR